MDAGVDVVLDLTANRRTDEALGSPFTITIDHIFAGDDVDVVLNDSKNGNDLSTLTFVTINLYNPATPYYHYILATGFDPALGADSGPLNVGTLCGGLLCGSGQYQTHFRPDHVATGLENILRAFGTIDDQGRLDVPLPGWLGRGPQGRRRHRPLPRLDHRARAEDVLDHRNQRRRPT